MAITKTKKKKNKQKYQNGLAFIYSNFNNTIVTITNPNGDTISWSSAGACGFKGSRKGTPFAAQQAAFSAAKEALSSGLHEVEVQVKGPGPGREHAIRAIENAGISIATIKDVTPIAHNGCRPPKKRRV